MVELDALVLALTPATIKCALPIGGGSVFPSVIVSGSGGGGWMIICEGWIWIEIIGGGTYPPPPELVLEDEADDRVPFAAAGDVADIFVNVDADVEDADKFDVGGLDCEDTDKDGDDDEAFRAR